MIIRNQKQYVIYDSVGLFSVKEERKWKLDLDYECLFDTYKEALNEFNSISLSERKENCIKIMVYQEIHQLIGIEGN